MKEKITWKRYAGFRNSQCGSVHHLYVDGKDTGWYIRHCGHPTALYPYAIYNPLGMHVWRTTLNNHGDNQPSFRLLKDAKRILLWLTNYQ